MPSTTGRQTSRRPTDLLATTQILPHSLFMPKLPAPSPSLELRDRVVHWKSRFFGSAWARYDLALPPTFKLVPPPEREAAIRRDYQAMRDMYMSEPQSLERILSTLADVERQVNGREGRS